MSSPNARNRARRRARAATVILASGSVAGLVALIDVVSGSATTRDAVRNQAPSATTTLPTTSSTTSTTIDEPSSTSGATSGEPSSTTSTEPPTTVYSPPVTSYAPPISRSGAT